MENKAMSYRYRILYAVIVNALCGTVLLLAQSGIPPAEIERVGQSGWQFLKINGDARQAAMGGAFTAISQGDANGVFGNPATLADVKNLNIQLNALRWVADINHKSFAVAGRLGDVGVVAVSLAMLDYGDIPETVNFPLDANSTTPIVTGNMFTANDLAVGISFARDITSKLSLGGNVRWIRQTIAELSMSNWSFDLGTMYYTGFKSLRLAISARNFGPDSRLGGWSDQYQTESDNVRMPFDFRGGLAMDFLNVEGSPHLLTIVAEGDHPNDGTEKFHLGGSYSFDKTFFLRFGYKFNYDVQKYTFGVGLNFAVGETMGSLNYAYADFGELTRVHLLSFGFSF
jgi:hypothetical protein